MKEKVFKWIEDGCNFNQGLTLLSDFGKKKQLSRAMAGHEKRYAGKLFYELCKVAGYSMAEYQLIKAKLEEIVEQFMDQDVPDGPSTVTGTLHVSAKENQLPADVQLVIKEHSDLFKLRAQLHEQMAELPEDNADETIKKRKNLSDSIAVISPKIDLLFSAKEAFYNEGKLPDMAVLFPEPKETSPVVDSLPEDPAELKKLKKNLQSANTKDQNQLEYQEDKKGSKSNLMPKGPKRLKIEVRIKERLEKITLIDFKLLEIAGTNL